MLPEINNYLDLIKKLDYDIERFDKTNHIYELLDCFLTLNAIPEWIKKDIGTPKHLMDEAEKMQSLIKGGEFIFNENELDKIEHKLKLVSLISNHAKHNNNSKKSTIPIIKTISGNSFPASLPVKFSHAIVVGENEIDAEYIIKEASNFWKDLIKNRNR